MARGLRLSEPGRAWGALAALAALGALAAWFGPAHALDWQPARWWQEPWRWWTGAFVHWSGLHLAGNLAGAALVGALGVVPRLPWRAALAWALAWPLTQLGLLLQPALAHYGGLSGVMHAGVAVASVEICRIAGVRWVGWSLLAGLAAKIVADAPWAGPLRHEAGWDIAIAPLAHASGALSGVLLAVLLPPLLARAARLQHRAPPESAP